MENILGFAGHRIEKLNTLIRNQRYRPTNNKNFVGAIKSILYIKINEYIDKGFRKFYIGMSSGIDLWAGQILLELKACQYPDIEIVAVQPFPDHGDMFRNHDKRLYEQILGSSDSVICLNYPEEAWCFLKRDEYMVSHITHLLAFVCDIDSGTGYTINCASEYRKSIEIVDLSEKIFLRRTERFLFF